MEVYDPPLSAVTVLPNGVTATTQTAGDTTTKVATDAFVATAIANAIAGVNPAVAVQAATTTAGNTSGLTYLNGAAGIGATFTGVANTALTIDGYTFTAINQRLLVKNDTQSPSGAFNGVYYVTQVQTAILPIILTRALDYDMPSDINNTGAIPVVNGTVNALTSWLLTSTVATVGTDPLTYSQFSYAPFASAPLANSISGDVALNNTSNYFDGPVVAQGSTGTWFASGSVTVLDTGAGAQFFAKLWDGTTVIDSGSFISAAAGYPVVFALSGFLAAPAGNLRISVRDISAVTGAIKASVTGTGKDSTISAYRIV